MAESQIDATVMLTNNSKILVTVDEALPDVIVVSYVFESKLFQGVLLNSTKRFLPCKLSDDVATDPKVGTSEEDKLYFSVRQRFTYFQEKHVNHIHLQKKVTSKSKNQKMTLRLRPRQVLCSKCKSICNENSENVNSHATRNNNNNGISKSADPADTEHSRLLFKENLRDNRIASPPLPNSQLPKLCPSFVPRLPRITRRSSDMPDCSQVISNGSPTLGQVDDEFWMKPQELEDDGDEDDRQMVLRKKRSVGSMEDLWDETVFEESNKKAKTTPLIKISFGSQGEGTILKIPPKVQECKSVGEIEPTEIQESKAVKKAMKKAKKEAKKKTASPERMKCDLPSQPEESLHRKHRHKVKHKKKHKEDKLAESIKEHCLKRKLSINLKRVTPTTYEKTEVGTTSDSSSASPSNEMPNFPVADSVVETNNINSCKTTDGSVVAVGDIVWGKIQGCPWWPGKILNIVIKSESNCWHAHVSWYGSTTSSIMPCDQLSPFLQTFKVRYNRRKKSAGYKEAIRQATSEASASNPEITLPEGVLAEDATTS